MTSAEIVPLVRELYSRHPEYWHQEAGELAHILLSLGYTYELLDEGEIAAAIEVARTDVDPDREAA